MRTTHQLQLMRRWPEFNFRAVPLAAAEAETTTTRSGGRLGLLFLAPKGASFDSPGRSPGMVRPSTSAKPQRGAIPTSPEPEPRRRDSRPCHGVDRQIAPRWGLVKHVACRYPGRRPGLSNDAPLGLGQQTRSVSATIRFIRVDPWEKAAHPCHVDVVVRLSFNVRLWPGRRPGAPGKPRQMASQLASWRIACER